MPPIFPYPAVSFPTADSNSSLAGETVITGRNNIDIKEQYTDIQHHNHETRKAFTVKINTVKDYFDAFRCLTEKELQEIPLDNHKDGK